MKEIDTKKHPDFNEWLKTPDGLSSNDINTLAEQKYLTNRLFWAFDAGRNCVWDQYLEQKKIIVLMEQKIKLLQIALREIRDFNDDSEWDNPGEIAKEALAIR